MASVSLSLLVRNLLGDWGLHSTRTVDQWIAATRDRKPDSPQASFAFGCACLFDSRLERARNAFVSLIDSNPVMRVAASLGHARVQSALRRYSAAEPLLNDAEAEAESLGEPILLFVVRMQRALLESDWRADADPEFL